MSYSTSSEQTRRQYPRETDGAKNEWKALIDHYTEGERKSMMIEQKYQAMKSQMQKHSNGA